MTSPNLSEIVTTTLRNRSGKLADNVTNSNALLYKMKQRGNVKPVSGGRTIVQELEYAENSTYKRYAGYETLNTSPSDVFTAAEFDWKQIAVAVTISGLEGDIQNTGAEQVLDLLESRLKNAERTMMNGIAEDIYSDGTASSGKQIGGLQLLVADTPTSGTVGGINRATWEFWRNKKFQCTSDGGSAASSANIEGFMQTLLLSCSRGKDRPDLIVSDSGLYQKFWGAMTDRQRITDSKMAEAGFENIKFAGIPVVPDTDVCPTNHMYFLNTEYIHYRPHRNRNMVPLDAINSINQDAMVKFLVWAGNMTLSGARFQGVLFQT